MCAVLSHAYFAHLYTVMDDAPTTIFKIIILFYFYKIFQILQSLLGIIIIIILYTLI